MLNPFHTYPKIDTLDQLYQRSEAVGKLKDFMESRTHTVLMGPEGVGKTTLLNSFFNNSYRREMARNKVLIATAGFTTVDSTAEAAYGKLANALRIAVESLEFCGACEDMNMILGSMDRKQYDSSQSRFSAYMDKIYMCGYRAVLILDHFEKFTNSPDICEKHHQVLCDLIEEQKLQLIVATNYDFNKTSLPKGIHNSTLLSRLSPNRIEVLPLEQDNCSKLLVDVLERKSCGFRFNEEQLLLIHQLSGGIPHLVYAAAKYVYEAVNEQEDEEWRKYARRKTLAEVRPLLKRWCKIMTKEQLEVLKVLMDKGPNLDADEESAAAALKSRGILQDNFYVDRRGRHRKAEGYLYICELLKEFSANPVWMKEAERSNPLRKLENEQLPAQTLGFNGKGEQGAVFNGCTFEFYNGDKVENKYQPTLVAGGFQNLFEVLDLSPDMLGTRLNEIFHASLPEVIDEDQKADRISAMFIPEAVEKEELEDFQEEQKTLESRFQSVRSKVAPGLEDSLLAQMSTKCRLYMQIAVVVDDALSVLEDFHLGDLSAQMVMYGKVLEQQLRDNLFNLFHGEDTLSDCRIKTKGAKFRVADIGQTTIGSYSTVLKKEDIDSHLQELCADNSVLFGTEELTKSWWNQLGTDVDEARELRNKTDHAGSEINEAKLERMRELLFGGGRILSRCFVGRDLAGKLWPCEA